MGSFAAHRGLIALSAGGAVAETAALAVLAPGARALGPQVTALPPLAAYHDLRWMFASGQSWPVFCALLAAMLGARAALDAVLVLLAWPRGARPPAFRTLFWSCGALTLVVWLVLSPAVTLMFGVALVPFSWPFLAAVPILLGTAIMLSHGGVGPAWWRRMPAARTAGWLIAGFAMLSAVAAVSPRLNLPAFLAVAALAGLGNGRAWYGAAAAVSTIKDPKLAWVPVAPVAAVLVIALVTGLARLTLTGTIKFTSPAAATTPAVAGSGGLAPPAGGRQGDGSPQATLVVAGFGSRCCHDGDGLAAAAPGMLVRQFSYLGLSPGGQPVPYQMADDLPIQVLGDRMAAQVAWLHARTHGPVDIVAESEGTLGLYAMLARHPGSPVGAVVLLSPIVDPGQADEAGVPGAALAELNDLVGTMSPYGSKGARHLISSVSEVGAVYFAELGRQRRPGFRWLAVVPLADAVTLPPCPYPRNVVVVDAFHGGLLGDPQVRRMVAGFLDGTLNPSGNGWLSAEAQLIAAAASAWRMPAWHQSCPG